MAKAAPRTVLITGCSSGIGLRTAVQLAQDPGKRFHGESWANQQGVGLLAHDTCLVEFSRSFLYLCDVLDG